MLTPEGFQPPLQPTPTIITCHATLEALAWIQQEMLSFPCFPTLGSDVPDLPVSDSRRAPWQCPEEDLHNIEAASRLDYQCEYSMRHGSTLQSSLLTPVIASTFRVQDFSTGQPLGTAPSSFALNSSATYRVNDRTGSRKMIAQALRSIMTRHPSAWRQSIKQRSQRGESMGPLQHFLRLALKETGRAHAPPLRSAAVLMATSSMQDCSSNQYSDLLCENEVEDTYGLVSVVPQAEPSTLPDDKQKAPTAPELQQASYTR